MFEGAFTALITPFKEGGGVDEESLRRLVDYQIDEGIAGLVPMGTTGESPTLNHEEHMEVIRIVIDQCRGRVPVISGTGSNSTREALSLTLRAKEAGASGALLVSPYYNRPTPEGQYRHYKQIADSVELPLIIYNIPGRTGINIDNTTMLKLAQHRNIVGAKDATKDISQMMALLAESPANFNVLSGDDSFTYPLVALGGRGVISVAGNLVPSRMADLVKAGLEGDMVKARALHYELLPLFRALSVETNPIPIKAAMAFKGFGKEIFRLPMCPMSGERREALRALLVEMDLI